MRYKATIIRVLKRAEDIRSFQFIKPRGFEFLPGQYLFVSVQKSGKALTKPLSISSSPTEDFLEVTKRLTGHEFSNAMTELRVGDEIYIDGPNGSFTFMGEYPKVGMLAGGIGITPLISMIKYCTHKQVQSSIILLYGNRSEENIPFFEELNQLAKNNKNFRVIHTLSRAGDSWKGRRGHVDSEMIKEHIPDYEERVFYVSGPPGLVKDCTQHLRSLGVNEEKIKTENFIGY
ncbi:MAG: FAD-dependent oxidoreductase [Candidatus Methanomethyliaceae archaeon]|nr:FAD-dependent oxidoreductase [Candidatus Methanomethyliaceae archaeon]